MIRKYLFLLSTSGLLFLAAVSVHAQLEMPSGELNNWHFDAPTIERGYTVSTPDQQFFVGILPNVLKGETDVHIKIFNHTEYTNSQIYQVGDGNAAVPASTSVVDPQADQRIDVSWPLPEGKEIVSPIYEFDIKGAADLYDPSKPLWLRVQDANPTLGHKGVYYFDKGKQQWIEIPTYINAADSSLRAAIHLTYAPMAILQDAIPTEGQASWYSYQNCNCAASRDYPPGTLLTVTDLNTQKSVIVEVNDYGPEAWTGRIIDLDVTAFEQLTEKWRGLTTVKVEPYILDQATFEQQGLPKLYGVQDQTTTSP